MLDEILRAVFFSAVTGLPGWVLVAMGFYFALRVLRFPDLTVDATFIAGAAAAAWEASHFDSSLTGLCAGLLLGGLGGALTALLYSLHQTPIFKLLASVLVMFSFYSFNTRIIGMKTSRSFSTSTTAFNRIIDFEAAHGMNVWRPFGTGLLYLVCIVLLIATYKLLQSRVGVLLRAVGSRPTIVANTGHSVGGLTVLGLVFSNALVGAGGWVLATGDASVNINTFGTVIHALAAVILGEVLLTYVPLIRNRQVSRTAIVAVPVLGGIAYQVVRSVVVYVLSHETESAGGSTVWVMTSIDQNLFFSCVLVILIAVSKLLRTNSMILPRMEAESL